MRLKDKVAIITGGSTGIGYAITEAYLREGAKVVIASYDKKEIEDAIDTLCEKYDKENIFGVTCNVKNTSDIKEVVQKTIERYNRIDILINNAGITNSGPTENVTDEDFENMFEVNTFGVFKFIREVIPYMKKQGQGSIINTSSMVANDGSRMQTAYTASKYAVNGITKSCAKELGAYGIRVNAVAPGAVLTNMVKKATTEEMRQMLCKTCALGKIAEPKELAGAYVYLGSDEASYTTGSIVRVDGGPF